MVDQNMLAAILPTVGPPEVLELRTVQKPRPTNKEVLIRVRACGLNHGLDGRVRKDMAGRRIQFPHILGTEVAGIVEEIGPDVQAVKPGQQVVVAPWLHCGHCGMCLRGQQNLCSSLRMVGIDTPGGYAEYVAVPEGAVVILPPNLANKFSLAACLPISYVTAWHMIKAKANLAPSETLLILGAAGAVGIAAVQLGRLLGARVVAAASDPLKRDFLRKIGADEVVDYRSPDFAASLMELTDGDGVDVLVNHIGQQGWQNHLDLLGKGGRMTVCGATTGTAVSMDVRALWRKNISIHFSNSGNRSDLEAVISMADRDLITPIVTRSFQLSEIVDAHHALESKAGFGKLVLEHAH